MSFYLEQITFLHYKKKEGERKREQRRTFSTSFRWFYKPTCLYTHSSLTAFCSSVSSRLALIHLPPVIAVCFHFTAKLPKRAVSFICSPYSHCLVSKIWFRLLCFLRTALILLIAKSCGHISFFTLVSQHWSHITTSFFLKKLPCSMHHTVLWLFLPLWPILFSLLFFLCLPLECWCFLLSPLHIFFRI